MQASEAKMLEFLERSPQFCQRQSKGEPMGSVCKPAKLSHSL